MLIVDFLERKNPLVITDAAAVQGVGAIVVIKLIAGTVQGKAAAADAVCHTAHKGADVAGLSLIRRHIRAADQYVHRTVIAGNNNALKGCAPSEHRNFAVGAGQGAPADRLAVLSGTERGY